MLRHLFRYTPQMMFLNRDGILFGLLFPFAFGIIYLFVFTGLISNANKLESIPVAMVFEGNTVDIANIKTNLQGLAHPADIKDEDLILTNDLDEAPLMKYIKVTNLDEGRQLADRGLVVATVIAENNQGIPSFSIEVSPAEVNNFTSSIIYSALNSFQSVNAAISTAYVNVLSSPNPFTAYSAIDQRLEEFKQNDSLIVDTTNKDSSSSNNIYFYAAIAYICIFFMSTGIEVVRQNEANFSAQALRSTMAPIPKAYRFIVTFISWAIPSVIIVNLIILIYYLNDVPLGSPPIKVSLIASIGVFVGLLMGTTIASILKSNENLMQAIAIGFPLVLGAFSGMMSSSLKVLVNENFPWFNKVNPVSLINDGIYYLNNYPSNEEYYQNTLILIAYIIILLALTIFGLRRTDYESL
ncbi:ABC transporter permease [Aerococcaceae bacterium WGS1372]